MKFYITEVLTPASNGKTRKCAMLQTVARMFERCSLDGTIAVFALGQTLARLAHVANNIYPGKTVAVRHSKTYRTIEARLPFKEGGEAIVFCIKYVPEKICHSYSSARDIIETTVSNLDQRLFKAYQQDIDDTPAGEAEEA